MPVGATWYFDFFAIRPDPNFLLFANAGKSLRFGADTKSALDLKLDEIFEIFL